MIDFSESRADVVAISPVELPPSVVDYVYFCYRAIEIWQRLIPFRYGSQHYDDCARCYARLGKLLGASAREVSIAQVTVAVEVVSTRLFHLAADNPPVAARLLEQVMRTFLRSEAVVSWAHEPVQANILHSAIIRRFSELSEVFNRQVCGLWGDVPVDDREYSDALKFCELMSRIHDYEAGEAGGPRSCETDNTRSM